MLFIFTFFLQLSEEITGPPPVDDKSIEEESAWIYAQLTSGGVSPLFVENQVVRGINKEDIGNVLGMLHVQKLDVRALFCFFLFCFIDPHINTCILVIMPIFISSSRFHSLQCIERSFALVY